MTDTPRYIKQGWTNACIKLDQAYEPMDIAQIMIAENDLIGKGWGYPDWIMLMIDWKKDDPLLTTEEAFRKRYALDTNIRPGFEKRPLDWKKEDSIIFKKDILKVEREGMFIRDDMLRIWTAIQEIYETNRVEAFRQALYGLTARILAGHCGQKDGLYFEFHAKADEFQYMTTKHNYEVFKQILKRESEFWESDSKLLMSTTKGRSGVKPTL